MTDSSLTRSLLRVVLVTALLLLVPLVAMRFTPEVNWGAEDFLAAGMVLFGAGAGIVLARRHLSRRLIRNSVVVLVVLVAALVWAELAVGILD